MSSGLDVGFIAARRARESPMSHVRVASATVANVMLPKIMAHARVETGASSEAECTRAADVILLTTQ